MFELFSIESVFLPTEMLLQLILNTYLNSSYCLVFVSEVNMDYQFLFSFTNIAINETRMDYLVDEMVKSAEMGCSDYIVRMKKPSEFVKAFESVNHLATTRRSDKKIVILPYANDEDNRNVLLNVLSMKESSFVANLLLVIPEVSNYSDCVSYDLVTHKFVGPDAESSQPLYLDKWDSCDPKKFKHEVNLFPHEDLTNINGRTVKVACFTYRPYVLLDLDTSVVPSGRDGIEMRLVDEFCRWINCTIVLVRADEEQWGEIYQNATGSGVLGNVVEDRADLAISALYSWYEEYLYLDFSSPSIRTAITCIAPAPRLLISWEMPLVPFSWNMWIGVLLTLIVSSLALMIAQGTSDKAFLIAFGTLTAQSHDDSRISWRRRSVTAWLFLAGPILCNAYGAGLASTFTVPKYEKSIDTIQDIIDTKSEWGATHDAWVFSLTLSKEPRIQQLVKQFRIYKYEELKQKSLTRGMLFSIEKLPSVIKRLKPSPVHNHFVTHYCYAGSFAIGEYITEEAVQDFMLMQEDFYYEQNVVMMRKSSPYTKKISILIGRLHESGLLLAWETQVALKHLNYKVQQEVKLSRSKKDVEIVPLSFRHIVGIFYMYVFGMAMSILFFMIELAIKRDKSELITRPNT